MSEQDDIFDLEDFIAKHGDRDIKKTWKSHMAWHNECEKSYGLLRDIIYGLVKLGDAIKEARTLVNRNAKKRNL